MNIDDEIKKVAFRLRRFREKNNMSREEFCEKTGDNVEYWGCIERGTRSISLKKLINVCRTFHISASEFIDGKSNKNSYEVKKQLILVEFQCYIQENQQELTNEGYEITFMEEEPIRIRYYGISNSLFNKRVSTVTYFYAREKGVALCNSNKIIVLITA